MKNEIITAIAEWLEAETEHKGTSNGEFVAFSGALNTAHFTHSGFCQEIAAEIAGKLEELLNTKTRWKDAPPWANYRTVDKDGTITYWDMEPYKSYGEEKWKHQNARVNFKEIKYFHTGWENSLEQRP